VGGTFARLGPTWSTDTPYFTVAALSQDRHSCREREKEAQAALGSVQYGKGSRKPKVQRDGPFEDFPTLRFPRRYEPAIIVQS
jgi:hypothetical protein